MSDPKNQEQLAPTMPWVIACGDEGVQINFGRRLAFLGAGLKMANFEQILAAVRQMLDQMPNSPSDRRLRLVANEENAFVKAAFELNDFDEANASMQQHLQVLADQNDLLYAGLLPFADPLELAHDIKGHMVRPRNVHIANKICFTIAGGETTYNLGQYLISADWLTFADLDLARRTLATQVEFYQTLAKQPLSFVLEEAGDLPAAIVAENKKMLQSLGYNFA